MLLVLITQQWRFWFGLLLICSYPATTIWITTKYAVKFWSITEFNKAGTPGSGSTSLPFSQNLVIVKLRRGSGKDRQGMAVKAKGLKA